MQTILCFCFVSADFFLIIIKTVSFFLGGLYIYNWFLICHLTSTEQIILFVEIRSTCTALQISLQPLFNCLKIAFYSIKKSTHGDGKKEPHQLFSLFFFTAWMYLSPCWSSRCADWQCMLGVVLPWARYPAWWSDA